VQHYATQAVNDMNVGTVGYPEKALTILLLLQIPTVEIRIYTDWRSIALETRIARAYTTSCGIGSMSEPSIVMCVCRCVHVCVNPGARQSGDAHTGMLCDHYFGSTLLSYLSRVDRKTVH
jgi:hypothetical protein